MCLVALYSGRNYHLLVQICWESKLKELEYPPQQDIFDHEVAYCLGEEQASAF